MGKIGLRLVLWLAFAGEVALVQGCWSGPRGERNLRSPWTGGKYTSAKRFEGVWRGTETSFTDNRRVTVEFDVWHTPKGEIMGYYHCAPINGWCVNNIDYGTVHGRATDPSFMLKLQDQTWCNFFGSFATDTAEGRFDCYGYGVIRNAGVWKIRRVPGELPTCGWNCHTSRDAAWSKAALTPNPQNPANLSAKPERQ